MDNISVQPIKSILNILHNVTDKNNTTFRVDQPVNVWIEINIYWLFFCYTLELISHFFNLQSQIKLQTRYIV